MTKTLSLARRIAAVACGGFCGTLLRVLLSSIIQGRVGKAWPYDILLINCTGALVLAFVTTLADATTLIGPTRRLFINVGLLGAYTTFSSLALGDVLLMASGQWLAALGYLAASSLGGMTAVLLGDLLGQWCVKKIIGRRFMIPLETTLMKDHVDVQDDLLLPGEEDEREAERRER